MTSSAAFRRVQAWLLEKPAAWADEDAPCLAAALMAQRPPCDMLRKRPREDALLEAERSHQPSALASRPSMRSSSMKCCALGAGAENRNLRLRIGGLNDIIDRERERARERVEENRILRLRVAQLGEIRASAQMRFRALVFFSRFLDNAYIRPAAAAQRDDFLSGLPVRAGMALEKPAAWADADAASLAAALMVQRPPARAREMRCSRPSACTTGSASLAFVGSSGSARRLRRQLSRSKI